jgi:hypothetical protein
MTTNGYFIDSAKFTWFVSLSAFIIFLLEDFYGVKRNQLFVLLPKLVFYQAFLFEIFLLKYKKHRLSLTPSLINISLRNFIVHIVFGLFNYRKCAFTVHLCWFLIDTFKFLHIVFNNRFTGFLKYKVSIPLFIIHGILECFSILGASFSFILPLRVFAIFVLLVHTISLQIVLKHKILQLLWYKKSRKNTKQ